jgi:cytochrome P450
LGQFLAGNLVDGVHTASLASANTFYVLVNHPEAMQAVQNSPELMARAIAEALRLEPPVLYLPRYALRDFHHDGFVVPAGNVISMMWAAGNHDPAAFPEPEKFDITRQLAGTTTFGNGIHICPGRYVGVMLVKILIETFAANGLSMASGSGSAAWFPSHLMAQLENMPIRMRKE